MIKKIKTIEELLPIIKSHVDSKKTLSTITEFNNMIKDAEKQEEDIINFHELPITPPKHFNSPM